MNIPVKLRQSINWFIMSRNIYGSVGNTAFRYSSITDFHCAKKAIKHGLGYNSQWILAHVQNGDTVLDVGSNVGFFPLWLRHNGKYTIGACVDADKTLCEIAYENIQLNDMELSWTTFHCAVSYDSSRPIRRHPLSAQNGMFSAGEIIKAPRIGLQELKNATGWKRFDLLKLDIEGAEYEILSTEPDAFEDFKHLVIEWHEPFCNLEFVIKSLPSHKLDLSEKFSTGGYAYLIRND